MHSALVALVLVCAACDRDPKEPPKRESMDYADCVVTGRMRKAELDELVFDASELSTRCPDRYRNAGSEQPRYR